MIPKYPIQFVHILSRIIVNCHLIFIENGRHSPFHSFFFLLFSFVSPSFGIQSVLNWCCCWIVNFNSKLSVSVSICGILQRIDGIYTQYWIYLHNVYCHWIDCNPLILIPFRTSKIAANVCFNSVITVPHIHTNRRNNNKRKGKNSKQHEIYFSFCIQLQTELINFISLTHKLMAKRRENDQRILEGKGRCRWIKEVDWWTGNNGFNEREKWMRKSKNSKTRIKTMMMTTTTTPATTTSSRTTTYILYHVFVCMRCETVTAH